MLNNVVWSRLQLRDLVVSDEQDIGKFHAVVSTEPGTRTGK